MMTWTSDELTRIGEAEELQIAAVRPDGALRNPVTIWVDPPRRRTLRPVRKWDLERLCLVPRRSSAV